ncbi:heterokaryon incompatibility protein-domain-containing protein [Podospora aff. communis PSN243]|uniref:Heterokaryon incompatibility protein-domain-containing protein n=1 Tax=Podospora aff. communis PSN243 TaxID=3040156 RepID=A0AAV9GCH1_9PEZI|nr:heterokaryon incompatibility protein-domain-containing protein [Podospora aff. communis PSN243]
MGAAASYENSPLPNPTTHIRLLHLHPSPTHDLALHGTLTTAPLSQPHPPHYEALSYVWGPPSQGLQPELFLADHSLPITPNLSTALRHLRYESQTRVLWVDAVCINQASDYEKTFQVRRMRDIYALASHVVIFLGEGSGPDYELVMDFLNLPEADRESWTVKPLAGFKQLLALPWWSRMWVVQEVAVPARHPTLMWGRRTAPWGAVRASVSKIAACHMSKEDNTWGVEERFVENPGNMVQFMFLRAKEGGPGEMKTLEWMLMGTKLRKATDPRDKVFALLGMTGDADGEGLEADYSLGLSEVFQAAMVYLIVKHEKPEGKMDFLLSAVTRKPLFVEKPTWCTDFSSPSWGRESFEQGWAYNQMLGNASKGCCEGLLPNPVHDVAAGTLTVRGTLVGVIQNTHTISSEYAYFRHRAREPGVEVSDAAWQDAFLSAVTELGTSIDDFTQLVIAAMLSRGLPISQICELIRGGLMWRVVSGIPAQLLCHFAGQLDAMGGVPGAQRVYGMLETYAQSRLEWRNRMSQDVGWARYNPPSGMNLSHRMAADLLHRVADCASGKTLFTTETGFFGASGSNAALMKGDFVAVVWGCSVPAVLRPRVDGGCSLITFAYVDSIMNGELFSSAAEARRRSEAIVLR